MKVLASAVDLETLNLTRATQILEHAGRWNSAADAQDPLAKLQALIDGLCDLSMHDGLTGLVNSTFFRAALASELDRSLRTGRTCAVLFLDLDRFKHVNDTYGHATGDCVLQAAAHRLKSSLRSMDIAARIGGEEFAVILPECGAEEAVLAANRIHGVLCPIMVTVGEVTLAVTASGGLAWTDPCIAISPKDLMCKADAELYQAKHTGRQRLCYPDLVATRVSVAEHAAVTGPRFEEGDYGQ